MNFKGTRSKIWILLCVSTLSVCAGIGILTMRSSSNIELAGLSGRQRFVVLEHLALALTNGMTKANVERHIGKPDNSDTNCVWFWISSDVLPTNKVLWVDHFNDDDGRYLLFYHDKLVSPLLKNTEVTPWEYFKTTIGASDAEVELLLGPKPRIVSQ